MFQQNMRVLDTLRSGHLTLEGGEWRTEQKPHVPEENTLVPLDTNIRGGCTSAILAVLLFELREKSYSSPFTEQELHRQVSSEVKVDPGSSKDDIF